MPDATEPRYRVRRDQRVRGDQDITLDNLSDEPRWVAWREELRDGKPTKVPYDPETGRRAATDARDTWSTREPAERRFAKMQRQHADTVGGVGIVLGDLGDGTHLMGIDLDGCSDEKGRIAPWADEIMDAFDTYAEVSPSGRGIKLFFLIAAADADNVADLIDGKSRRAFAVGKHREIALDRVRYYTVTGERQNGGKDALRLVSFEDVRWLLEDAGPKF